MFLEFSNKPLNMPKMRSPVSLNLFIGIFQFVHRYLSIWSLVAALNLFSSYLNLFDSVFQFIHWYLSVCQPISAQSSATGCSRKYYFSHNLLSSLTWPCDQQQRMWAQYQITALCWPGGKAWYLKFSGTTQHFPEHCLPFHKVEDHLLPDDLLLLGSYVILPLCF